MHSLRKFKQFISQLNSSFLVRLQTCGSRNCNLAKPIFKVNIMMRIKDPRKNEFFNKCLQQGYDSLNKSTFY